MIFGAYRTMWVLVLFDLPVDTKEAKRRYHAFHDFLCDDGFSMLQYSVYGRHCPSEENASVHIARIETAIPDDGQVRILVLTDKQFERMKVFFGKIRHKTEPPPEQVSFF